MYYTSCMRSRDLVGKRFGRLTVLRWEKGKWLCSCSCGSSNIVQTYDLVNGKVRSCGCLRKDMLKEERRNKNRNWKGGRKVDKGYILVRAPSHPNAASNGYVCEHIKVMSEILGRPLDTHECIHHKNGLRQDNREENLELWTTSHPSGQRVSDLVKWAKAFVSYYEKEEQKL